MEQGALLDDLDVELPPLPPRERARRREATAGCCLVLGVVVLCVVGTVGGANLMQCGDSTRWRSTVPAVLVTLVLTEASVAVLCLLGLMLADPGEVRRTAETTRPVPREIAAALRSVTREQLLLRNVTDGEDSYCVRCFVWRRPERHGGGRRRFDGGCGAEPAFHHCATCQRCVRDFDHHCGVFGRCIAGRGLRGNWKYFVALIAVGYCGAGTAAASLLAGAARCGGRGQWLGQKWWQVLLYAFATYVACCALACCASAAVWLANKARLSSSEAQSQPGGGTAGEQRGPIQRNAGLFSSPVWSPREVPL